MFSYRESIECIRKRESIKNAVKGVYWCWMDGEKGIEYV